MKFISAHNVSKCTRREVPRVMKGLLEVMSVEVPAENVGTVAGVQRWRQRIPDFRSCDREAMSA